MKRIKNKFSDDEKLDFARFRELFLMCGFGGKLDDRYLLCTKQKKIPNSKYYDLIKIKPIQIKNKRMFAIYNYINNSSCMTDSIDATIIFILDLSRVEYKIDKESRDWHCLLFKDIKYPKSWGLVSLNIKNEPIYSPLPKDVENYLFPPAQPLTRVDIYEHEPYNYEKHPDITFSNDEDKMIEKWIYALPPNFSAWFTRYKIEIEDGIKATYISPDSQSKDNRLFFYSGDNADKKSGHYYSLRDAMAVAIGGGDYPKDDNRHAGHDSGSKYPHSSNNAWLYESSDLL